MSVPPTTTPDPQPEPTTPPAEPQAQPSQEGEPKVFDAEYVAQLRRESAKYRTEAKANADAAKKLAEIEESQKTEQQKLADKLAATERRAQEAELRATRAEVARAKGVPAELLVGASEDELAASADALLAFRGAVSPAPVAPNAFGQGKVGEPVGTAVKQLTRADLQSMTPEQIVDARKAGSLSDLMSGRTR